VRAVITEAELRRLAPASKVLAPRGAIVTPSARDYARDNGIEIIETTGEGVFASPCSGNEGAARAAAFDATEGATSRTWSSTLSGSGRSPSRNSSRSSSTAGGWLAGADGGSSVETSAGVRLPPGMGVQEVMERVVRAAVARLGPQADRETLARVLAMVLIHLGYAVAVSDITSVASQDR
jgi:hypothetical protein